MCICSIICQGTRQIKVVVSSQIQKYLVECSKLRPNNFRGTGRQPESRQVNGTSSLGVAVVDSTVIERNLEFFLGALSVV